MGVSCWRIQQDVGVTWYTVGRLAKDKRTKQNTGMTWQRDAFTRSTEKLAKIKFHRGFDKRKSCFFSSSHRGRWVCPAAVSRLQNKNSPHNIGQTRVSVEHASDRPTDRRLPVGRRRLCTKLGRETWRTAAEGRRVLLLLLLGRWHSFTISANEVDNDGQHQLAPPPHSLPVGGVMWGGGGSHLTLARPPPDAACRKPMARFCFYPFGPLEGNQGES